MSKAVKLVDIIDAMMMQNESSASYLDRATDEVISILSDDEGLDEDEELEEHLELMTEDPERFAELPGSFDIHEWQMMEEFELQVKDDRLRQSLLPAIRGKGAFGRSKASAQAAGIIDQWYQFKERAFRDLALDWCRANHVEYIEDSPR